MQTLLKYLFAVVFVAVGSDVPAQLSFIANKGQWNDEVLYECDVQSGRAFFADRKITYTYYSTDDVQRAHELRDSITEDGTIIDSPIRFFAFQVEFESASEPYINGRNPRKEFYNYYLGKNSASWATHVPAYGELMYNEIYPGIDIRYYSQSSQLKYDFLVAPGADASAIRMKYTGQESCMLVDGNLVLDLGFTEIKEIIPSAYQFVNGKRVEVKCEFRLENNTVTFAFPEDYDKNSALVIDPVVIASTYLGSTGTTGGFSATYDADGNLYGGGDAFGPGLPVSLGAYNVNYSGVIDLAICKFNADGSNLIYCTYIGGFNYEFPQNLVASNGLLYIYGSTLSWDFPVTATAYDTLLDGISDIYVCCLDATGSNLLGSTLIGGNWGDGTSLLTPFYMDRYRGDVIVASNGDVLVTSTSMSTNFPTTPGAYRNTTAGGQDAVIFRMNSMLTNLIWSTYLGSGVHDVAWGIKEAVDGSFYVCGGTNNRLGFFPTTPGCYNGTAMGGADAFVVHFDANGSTLIASTLYGGSELDVAYYLDIDKDGDVYISGATRGDVPVTDGVWYCQNARVFVAKLNGALSELMYSTIIGSSSPTPVLTMNGPPVPPGPPPMVGPNPIRANNNAITAFKVDDCERTYIAAYVGNAHWPITETALYGYSDNNQFCVAVLDEDATSLLFSTMYCGLHVDGGSGDFDENGILYQASCWYGPDFQTMPWAYEDSTRSGVYDMCLFKMDVYVDLIDSVTYPNVFTPNGDGINDVFTFGDVTTKQFDITIFDRYGTPLFHSDDPQFQWDGTFNGKDCPDGVYYYTTKYYFCTRVREKGGFMQLSRQ